MITVVAFVTTTSSAQNETQPPEIAIGVIFPLSKTSSTFGVSLERGLLLSLSEKLGDPKAIDPNHLVYQPAGLNGLRVHLYIADDQAIPGKSESLAHDLIANKHVIAIIGSGNSNCTSRVRDVGVESGTPVLTPMSSATRLTTKATAGLFFRMQSTDKSKMTVVGRRLVDRERVKRLAIFYEDDEWYGEGLRDDLISALRELKFENYKIFKFSRNDARNSLRFREKELVEFKPDGAALLGLDLDVVAIGEYLKSLDLDIPAYFTGDNEEYLSKIPLTRAYALAMVYYRNSPEDLADQYRESFKRRYGEMPGSSSAHGYDAGTALDSVLRQMGSATTFSRLSLQTQRTVFAQQLAKVHFDGLLGTTSFDELGNANYRLNIVDMAELRGSTYAPWWSLATEFLYQHWVVATLFGGWLLVLLGSYVLLLRIPQWLPQIAAALERVDHAIQIKNFYLLEIFRAVLLPDFVIYRERILDRWMATLVTNRNVISKFENRPVVKERQNYVQAAIKVNGETIGRPDRSYFASLLTGRHRYCLEIVGEGGAGKTSLACQLAKWGLQATISDWNKNIIGFPPFLPLILDFDLPVDKIEPRELNMTFTNLVGERLCSLLDYDGELPEAMIKRLLRTRRIVLIVDRLSELSGGTASLIFDTANSSLVSALVVTSRRAMAEKFGRECTNIEPLRIDEQHLLPFLIEYLRGHEAANFTDEEYETIRQQIQEVVKGRRVTALFVTMYADVLLYQIASQEHSAETPKNLPELILAYIHRTNTAITDGLATSEVVRAGKMLAWSCLKRRLQPGEIHEAKALELLGADKAAQATLSYLVDRIHLLQAVGPTGDRYRFSLEPVAEYLAVMQRVEAYKDSATKWSELFGRANQLCAEGHSCSSFLRALRDVLTTSEAKPPEAVLESLMTLISTVEAGGNDSGIVSTGNQ